MEFSTSFISGTGPQRHPETQRALRVARAAPWLPLRSVAATAAEHERVLVALRTRSGRGRCARLLADGFVSRPHRGEEIIADKRCPPPIVRLAALTRGSAAQAAGSGTAAWAGRDPVHCASPRSRLLTVTTLQLTIAGNSSCPPAMLTRMAVNSFDPDTRTKVAANPATDYQVLALLAGDEVIWVRRHVAANPNSGPGLLRRLACDISTSVQNAVASNITSPQDVLETLCEGYESLYHRSTRSVVAANPACDPGLLERLAENDNTVPVVAANPNSDPLLLQTLTRHHNLDVRIAAASNPSTPPEALDALIRHDTERAAWKVRAVVAANPACSSQSLQRLARDPSQAVQTALADRGNRSQSVPDGADGRIPDL